MHFSEIAKMSKLGQFKTKQRGQTKCKDCGNTFNNASIPVNCNCGYQFDSVNQIPKDSLPNNAALLVGSELASVRLNTKGVGIRIFVNLTENKVGVLIYICNFCFQSIALFLLYHVVLS